MGDSGAPSTPVDQTRGSGLLAVADASSQDFRTSTVQGSTHGAGASTSGSSRPARSDEPFRQTTVMAGGKTVITIGDNRPTPAAKPKPKMKAWGQEFKGWGTNTTTGPAANEAPQQPEKSREERIAELQALLQEEEMEMELAKCTCFRLKCLQTRMFRAAASTLAVFFILLVVLSAGLIQQALEPPLPVGDDGFPHVTLLAVSGWGRLPQEEAARTLVVQMGVAVERLGAGLIVSAGDTLLPAPPPGSPNTSVTPAAFRQAFSQVFANPRLSGTPWRAALGDEDYLWNTSALLDPAVTGADSRWQAPPAGAGAGSSSPGASRSFKVDFAMPNTATALEELYDLYHKAQPLLTLIVLDTAPFVPALRAAAVAAEAAAKAEAAAAAAAAAAMGTATGANATAAALNTTAPALAAQGVAQVLPPRSGAANASAWAAWEARELAQLEGWLRESIALQKVVVGHHPLQWTTEAGVAVPRDAPGLMRVRALLEQYKADCYVSGHNGRLERAPSVNGSKVIYVNSGIPTQQQLAAMPAKASVWPPVPNATAAVGFRFDRPGFAAITADPYRVVVHLFAANGTLLHQYVSRDDGKVVAGSGASAGGAGGNSGVTGRRRLAGRARRLAAHHPAAGIWGEASWASPGGDHT